MRLTGGPRGERGRFRLSRRALRVLVLLGLCAPLLGVVATASSAAIPSDGSVSTSLLQRCPWAAPNAAASATPSALANQVLSHMDLGEKLTMVNLAPGDHYENRIAPIPALCLPAFTLQDGPNGIAYGDKGVTQLPSSLGIAASFDPALAYDYGQVEGSEAHGQGIDAVQGPNLNIDRVPESGRAFEGYGEDPFLVSEMGDADIEGIQSEGVLADAKHFTAYNQETDRVALDEQVSERALQEIYLAPFYSAVTVAHVASIMCSYGELNGVNDCSDPSLYEELYKDWGFTGFVRSDLGSVPNSTAAFAAGLDMIKPATPHELRVAVADHALKMKRLDSAVYRILLSEFTYNLIEHPLAGRIGEDVATRAHARFALDAAEESMVLLKNNGVLPLSSGTISSLAVIGSAAESATVSAGGGSANVKAPFVSKPLQAISADLTKHTKITYVPASSQVQALAPIAPLELHALRPTSDSVLSGRLRPGTLAQAREYAPTGYFPARLQGALSGWTASVTAPQSGNYEFSITGPGNTWLYVDNKLVYSSPGSHLLSSWTVPVSLTGGISTPITLRWYPSQSGAVPEIGWRYTSPGIAAAVTAAKHAQVAVVFANDANSEGADRPNLKLPGDEDALIAAVAAVNPHTVVVLDTGGPVLMPWLSKVNAVLESWYPGEQDGAATAAVLFGRVDPSGHLPVTFPASNSDTPGHTPGTWPGVAGAVSYSEGLDVGYRYQQAHNLTPLFPFGFGLSYTRFSLSGLQILPGADGGYVAQVTVHNRGSRAGADVVQGYLGFPPAAAEPPLQLKSFTRVSLAPHTSATVTMTLPAASFESYQQSGWEIVPGGYTLAVGQSSANLPLSATLPAPTLPASGGTLGTGNSGATASSTLAPAAPTGSATANP